MCALDPLPANLDTADLDTFSLLADLIAFELEDAEDLERREAEDNERRSFVDAVAHDLKGPLQVIKTQAQLLQRRLKRRESIAEDALQNRLAQIETSVDRGTALIDEMLDASRLRAGEPLELTVTEVDLGTMVLQVVDEYRQTSPRHAMTFEPGDTDVVGWWDRSRIARVLGNLLSNAIRYSPKGGKIAVSVHREDCGQGAWAVLAVRDEGIGIPAADLTRVFETYRRGRNVEGRVHGTGIGLAGAKQIIEQHEGTITVGSVEGQGSVFTVRLPLSPG